MSSLDLDDREYLDMLPDEPLTVRSDDYQPGGLEESIQLQHLKELQNAFKRADADGGGSLDQEEFVKAFGSILGKNLSEDQVTNLFMKIDANSDGSVDWEEFSTFMLLENQGSADMRDSEGFDEFVATDTPDVNPPGSNHKSMIDSILYVPSPVDRYVTGGRDGTIRVWHPKQMQHQRTIRHSTAWVTDMTYLPHLNKIAVSSFDRTLSFYDTSTFERTLKENIEDSPLCLESFREQDNDYVCYGDENGVVSIAHVDFKRPIRDSTVFRSNARQKHRDWVKKVRHFQDVGLISCSLDKTLKVFDLTKKEVKDTMKGHEKGVYTFDYCPSYRFIASGGLDRNIVLWDSYTFKRTSTLYGHTASIQSVIVNEECNQLISLSFDKVIKVWDVRSHRCLQTITDSTSYRPENRITSLIYDQAHGCLVSCAVKPRTWPMQKRLRPDYQTKSHKFPVCSALFNHNFNQIVSGDDDGVVCVWDSQTGELVFRFQDTHSGERVSAMAFDWGGRRLITGGSDGTMRMWNFSNGQCLKELLSRATNEITSTLYVSEGHNKYIVAVGWDRVVYVWPDSANYKTECVKELVGHEDDILSAVYVPHGLLATSSYDGMIYVWNLDSGFFKCSMSVPEDELQRTLPDQRPIERLVYLSRVKLIVSSGADGYIRFWNPFAGEQVYFEDARHYRGESIVALASDELNNFLVSGDTVGNVKLWDISTWVDFDALSEDVVSKSLIELVYFKAHASPVASVEVIDRHNLILTAGQDAMVCLFTMEGALVGSFTQASRWDLANPSSFLMKTTEVPPDPFTEEEAMKRREKERAERHEKRRQRRAEAEERAQREAQEDKLLEGFITPHTSRSRVSDFEEEEERTESYLEGVAAAEKLMTQSKKDKRTGLPMSSTLSISLAHRLNVYEPSPTKSLAKIKKELKASTDGAGAIAKPFSAHFR